MNLRIKKLHPYAKIPTRAHRGDAGLDITCVSIHKHVPTQYIEYNTGLAIEIPDGYVGLLFPRSSISNYALSLSNSVGVIDSNFRGELTFRFRPISGTGGEYNLGDKIGQLVILKLPEVIVFEVDELSESKRNTGGYGSSGV